MLPANHLLAQLILPHTRISLGLDKAVTHHRRSVLANSPQEVYTPFALDTEGTCSAVGIGRLGVQGSESYRPYDFWGREHNLRTGFGRYSATGNQHLTDSLSTSRVTFPSGMTSCPVGQML